MLRAALAALVVTALGTPASAGVYLGLGVGPAADTGTSDNSAPVTHPISTDGNGRSTRFMLGVRFGHLSLEGDVDHYGLLVNRADTFDAWDAALLLKYSFPLSYGFEVFGKGGLAHTWLTNNDDNPKATALNANGNGWVLGAGLEWRFNLVLAGCSLFVDYEFNSSSFANDVSTQKFDATTGMWMLGATVSI